MNIICKHCFALKWKEEKRRFCCLNGQIQLAQLKPPPPAIEILLTEEDSESNKPFVSKIIAYNQIFAFISISSTILDKKLANAKKGVYTYKIRGQHYHQHEYGWHKEEFLKIIEEEEIVDQFEEDEDQIANQVATNIIKDFNSNLTAKAKENIQQKEIIEVDNSSKTMSVEFDNLLQRSLGLSGVFDDIAFKSSTNMSISEL
ncbi:26929_t:CDS:2, partial [Dentiscutata erythropus]